MAGLPSDKMQLLGLGDLTHPGTCMSCGSGNYEGGYVRLGVYYEYEGEMFLCGNCVNEIAQTIGMLTMDEANYLRHTSEEYAKQYAEAAAELENARERLAIYDAAIRSVAPAAANLISGTGDSPTEDSPKVDFGEVRVVEQATGGSGSGEPEPKESITLNKRGNASRTKPANIKAGAGSINL